jgi:hypothetical protein
MFDWKFLSFLAVFAFRGESEALIASLSALFFGLSGGGLAKHARMKSFIFSFKLCPC